MAGPGSAEATPALAVSERPAPGAGAGAGDLVLFLHGLGCARESFAGLLDGGWLEGFHLLAPDLPGHGETPAPAGYPHTMEAYADAVAGLLARYDFRYLHVVAHSMGGAVGLLLAGRADAPLASFVDVEGNLTGDDCGLVSRRAAGYGEDEFAAEKFAKLLERVAGADDAGSRLWAEWLGRCDPRAFHRSATSLVALSDSGQLLETFRSLGVPKLYVCGETSANPAVLGALEGVPVATVAGAGHFLVATHAEAFEAVAGPVIRAGAEAGQGP